MPWMQASMERANSKFNRMNIDSIPAAFFGPNESLVDAAEKLEIITNAEERAALEAWPPSLKSAIQAALYDALSRTPRVPVQMAWKPAAGFGVGVWEAAGVGGSHTAITIELNSPLPAG